MLPIFFDSFVSPSMHAEQPGQQVSCSGSQPAYYQGLNRAPQGSGTGQSAFDPPKYKQGYQGHGHRRIEG
jgi:hypothetical protein